MSPDRSGRSEEHSDAPEAVKSRLILPRVSPLFLGSERAAELWVDEVIDSAGRFQYLDRSGSVSALIEIENDCAYVPDHNRLFLQEDPHGS